MYGGQRLHVAVFDICSMLNRRDITSLGAGFFLLQLLSTNSLASHSGGSEGIHRKLRFDLIISNPTENNLGPQKIYCYIPASIPNQQSLIKLDSSAPFTLTHDRLGHNIICFTFERFGAFSTQIISTHLNLVLKTVKLDQQEFFGEWLVRDIFIESDAVEILEIAAELARANDLATAKSIFNWTRTNINDSGYLAEDRGALEAMRTKHGDCTEFSYLIVALCRANNIPSRVVGGYVVQSDAVLAPYNYHNWAEIYINGNWLIADAQKGFWDPLSSDYIAFKYYSSLLDNDMGMNHRFRIDGDAKVSLV